MLHYSAHQCKTYGLFCLITLSLVACSMRQQQPAAVADQARVQAQARWEAQQIQHYQLLVEEANLSQECQQSLEIQDQQVQQVRFNKCGTVAHWTVPNLFTWLAQHPTETTRCYPSAVTCVCYITYSIHAKYDPTYGFPIEMTSAWRLTPNWSYSAHWQRLLQSGRWPSCRAVNRRSEGFVSIRVLDFAVLSQP
jgi:hypothetical protein